jgi:hypothetical protein
VHLLRHGDRIVITGGDADGTCQTKSFVLNPRPDFPEIEALEEPQVTTPPQCVYNAGFYDGVSCSCGSPEMIACNQQCMSSYSTQNCGRCGVTCLPNQTCSSGTCTDSL